VTARPRRVESLWIRVGSANLVRLYRGVLGYQYYSGRRRSIITKMQLRFVVGEPVNECSWQRVHNVTLTLTVYDDEEEPSFGDDVITVTLGSVVVNPFKMSIPLGPCRAGFANMGNCALKLLVFTEWNAVKMRWCHLRESDVN
jgi:hypothetical protein